MRAEVVQSLCQTVYRRFPDFDGVRPKVAANEGPGSSTYTLTFRTTQTVSGGKSLSRWVRVVADERGKILKLTTSR